MISVGVNRMTVTGAAGGNGMVFQRLLCCYSDKISILCLLPFFTVASNYFCTSYCYSLVNLPNANVIVKLFLFNFIYYYFTAFSSAAPA